MPYPRQGGSGGAGFIVGPPSNLFGTASGDVSTTPLAIQPAANRAAAEATRNTYFTANSGNLAIYDQEGNEALGIFLYFTDGGELRTVGQTRVGGEWRDSASTIAIPGLPGSGTDFSGISENHVPAIGPGPNFIPFDSGLVTSDLMLSTDKTIRSGLGSFRLGDAYNIESSGRSISLRNLATGDRFRLLVAGTTNTPSILVDRPAITEVAQPVFDTVITNPDNIVPIISFDADNPESGQLVSAVILRIHPTSVLTNITINISIGGTLFQDYTFDTITPSGPDNEFQFQYVPPIDVLVGDMFQVQISSTDGDVVVLGNNTIVGSSVTGQPYTRPTVALTDVMPLVIEDDLLSAFNNVERRSTSLIINASNVAQYQPFAMIEFTNGSGRPDFEIHDDVFDIGNTIILKHYSVGGNPGTGVRYEIDGGTIDGESDMILGQDSSIIAKKVASNTWRVVASHDLDTISMRAMIQDVVAGMVTGNTETNIAVTSPTVVVEGTRKLNFVVPADENTQLTTEEVQDIIGGMVAGNTETGIDVTYDDATGKLNFDVTDSTDTTRPELTYINVQADQLPATFTATGANSGAYAEQQTINIPTFTGSQYIVIAQPANEPDLTSVLIGSLNQLSTFTKASATATVGGESYEFWFSNNLILGSVLSNEPVTLNRG